MKKPRCVLLTVLLLAAAAAVAAGLAGPQLPLKRTKVWMCSRTGSTKTRTAWFGSLWTTEAIHRSPLDKWLEHRGRPVVHDWVLFSVRTRYIFGRGYACGRAPAVMNLPDWLQARFIADAKPGEVEEFVAVMRNGPRRARERAVNALLKRMSCPY